ncbi:aminomethyl-transferring glycine dehydrogenase subunit GcvPA [Chlamydiales bacterium]|nr:aminomethyl-transferring glycine dehydrogenase subunit GcvPA [Chlamydiales bacterium]
MDFISNKEPQIKAMLESMGVNQVEDLWDAIPESIRLKAPSFDDGLSESEGIFFMEELSKKNQFPEYESYLGGGAYDHYVPALVPFVTGKSEFLTAYTPYQPEVSQGMLQAIFEFQSIMSSITGLDVSNASVYDGASAAAEGLLMALRYFRGDKNTILIVGTLNPHYTKVVDNYFISRDTKCITVQEDELDQYLNEDVAAVLFSYPNFFGEIKDLKPLITKVKEAGALSILSSNPLVYALYQSANELGVDIATGDTQPFGLSLNYGGPYCGFISCTKELLRQMPGRLVGETVDRHGKKGYVLTLQAREQHIRREKATSNICTNQALAALASLVSLSWYGKEGLKQLALTNFQRASYLKENLIKIEGIESYSSEPFLNEFIVKIDRPLPDFEKEKIIPGLELEPYFPEMKNCYLIAVTELKSKEMLDRFIKLF